MHHPTAHPTVPRAEVVAVVVVTVAFACWLTLWAVLVPAFQAPDEVAHFDAAVQVALGHGWPAAGTLHVSDAVLAAVQQQTSGLPASSWSSMSALLAAAPGVSATVNQMTQHPPTAYLADAAVLRVVHYGALRWDHALIALRLADAAVVVPLAPLVWATVRRLTGSPRAAVLGAVALFAVPQLASIGASVTNDAPVMLLGAVVVWLTTRLLTGDLRPRTLVWLGVALGVLISLKGTGLPAVPVVAVAVLVAGSGSLALGRRAARAVVALAVAAVIGGWWWARNIVLFHTVQTDGYSSMRPPRPFPAGEHPTVSHFLDVAWGTLVRTFWGSPGGRAQVSIGDVLTACLTVVTLVVLVGWAFRRSSVRPAVVVLTLFPALLLAFQMENSVHAYLTTTEVAATQGRYLFPAIVALIAGSAVAWRRLARSSGGHRVVATVLSVAMPAVGVYGIAVVSAWFWNGARAPLTAAGLTRYALLGPVATAVPVVLGVLVAVGVAATVLLTTRLSSAPDASRPAPRAVTSEV